MGRERVLREEQETKGTRGDRDGIRDKELRLLSRYKEERWIPRIPHLYWWRNEKDSGGGEDEERSLEMIGRDSESKRQTFYPRHYRWSVSVTRRCHSTRK